MVRTQVQLTEVQARELKSIAQKENISMAELVRRSIDWYLDTRFKPSREELKQRALAAIGAGASGIGDIAENHDKYLDEIYGDFNQ